MKRLWGVPLLLLAGVLPACGDDIVAPPVCTPTSGKVARVKDGDTIELEDSTTVRYLLVDTAEVAADPTNSDCFAEEARSLNEGLVLGKEVTLEYDLENANADQCSDNFKRRLAYVSVGGHMVNRIMIERGYAALCVVKPSGRTTDYQYQAEFQELEARAQAAGAGLWGLCSTVPGACE